MDTEQKKTATIRTGRLEDSGALIDLDEIAAISADRRRLIETGLRNGEITVSIADGVPRGYALLSYRFFGHAFIELLYVQAQVRGTGLGTALIEHLLQQASGTKLFTSTNESNVPMRTLLNKVGFEESGIIHNLDPGDPELVYVRFL